MAKHKGKSEKGTPRLPKAPQQPIGLAQPPGSMPPAPAAPPDDDAGFGM